jgi:ribokinase
MEGLDIIGFGALNYDRLYVVDKIPAAGEEIVIKKIVEESGGSAANTIVGLSRLELKTGFIGIVGFDDEARLIMNAFETNKVDTSNISVTSSGRTGSVVGFVDKNGERSLSVYPGVNNSLEISDINIGYAKRAKFIHLSSFVSSKQLNEQIQLIRTLKKERPEIKISFSPGMIYARKGMEKLYPIIKETYVLFLAENEVRLLTGLKLAQTGRPLEKAGKIFLNKGVKLLVITLGTKGCYVTDGKTSKFIASHQPKKVVDTTGAGDAFAAGFLFGLLSNKNFSICGEYGNRMASECITKYGARKGLTYSIKNFKHAQASLLEIIAKS